MRFTTDHAVLHVRRLLDHMAWADARVLELLSVTPEDRSGEAARVFGHLLAAERVWLLRLTDPEAAPEPIWPEPGLDEMKALAAANAAGYARLMAGLRPDALQAEVAYTNSQGVAFRTPVGDVLLHVAMHGSYHRGQVAAAVRRGGGEPVNTDFITFVREHGGAGATPEPGVVVDA
jgi:uncharacterized damage-inducible protein DinB